jgi:hypothetical protein
MTEEPHRELTGVYYKIPGTFPQLWVCRLVWVDLKCNSNQWRSWAFLWEKKNYMLFEAICIPAGLQNGAKETKDTWLRASFRVISLSFSNFIIPNYFFRSKQNCSKFDWVAWSLGNEEDLTKSCNFDWTRENSDTTGTFFSVCVSSIYISSSSMPHWAGSSIKLSIWISEGLTSYSYAFFSSLLSISSSSLV